MAKKLMELVVINKILMEKVGVTREDIQKEADRLTAGKTKVEEN